MKRLFLMCVILLTGAQTFSFAPGSPANSNASYPFFSNLYGLGSKVFPAITLKKYQQLTGRKMILKERIAYAVLKRKVKRTLPEEKIKNENTPAILSVIFGMAALLGLVGITSPVIGLLSLSSAFAALIFGIIGLKRNKKDTRAWIGLIIGGAYLLLIIFLIAIDFGYK